MDTPTSPEDCIYIPNNIRDRNKCKIRNNFIKENVKMMMKKLNTQRLSEER